MVLILYRCRWRDRGRKQPWCKSKTGQRSNNCILKFKIDSIRPDTGTKGKVVFCYSTDNSVSTTGWSKKPGLIGLFHLQSEFHTRDFPGTIAINTI